MKKYKQKEKQLLFLLFQKIETYCLSFSFSVSQLQ